MPTATLERIHLTEHVASPPGRIDEENGVIYSVKVLGRESKRGRTYSDAALRDACRLYENVRVNFDHPNESNPAIVRGFFDQIGQLVNCRLGTDGVYADLHYLKSHPAAGMLIESARRFPRLFGLSHNADGDKRRGPGGRVIVESITQVRAVDLVTRPATNNGLFESHAGSAQPRVWLVNRMTKAQLAINRRWDRLIEQDDVSHDPSLDQTLKAIAIIDQSELNETERELFDLIVRRGRDLLKSIADRDRAKRAEEQKPKPTHDTDSGENLPLPESIEDYQVRHGIKRPSKDDEKTAFIRELREQDTPSKRDVTNMKRTLHGQTPLIEAGTSDGLASNADEMRQRLRRGY